MHSSQTLPEARHEADAVRKKVAGIRFSYDMLGEGARTAEDAQRYWHSYANAIQSIAAAAHPTGVTAAGMGAGF